MSVMIKRIKRYLILLLITSTGIFAGYSYVEDAITGYFASSVENTIKDAVVDKVKEKAQAEIDEAKADIEAEMKNKLWDFLNEAIQ